MNENLQQPGTDHVEQALAALRQASITAGAPENVETALRQAFRAQHQRLPATKHASARRYALAAAAVAASLLIAAGIRLSRTPAATAPQPAAVAKTRAPVTERAVAGAASTVRNEPKTLAQGVRPKARPPRRAPVLNASARSRREVTTDFIPIPYAPAMTQADYGQVVRVNVPATSMRTFGLPVSEERMFDRVQADVLMGEDGIARAVRFVRQQSSGLNYR